MDQPDIYLTAHDVAALAEIPVQRVWWLAYRDGWDKTRLRPRRYRYADVIRTLAAPDATPEPAGVLDKVG